MQINSYGSAGGVGQFDPQQMKAQFSKMKESVRSQNPEAAKKLDAFEKKIDDAQKNGTKLSEDQIKSYAKEAGLPDMPEGGQPPFGMGGAGGGGKGGLRLNVRNDESNDYSGYTAKGKGTKTQDWSKFLLNIAA